MGMMDGFNNIFSKTGPGVKIKGGSNNSAPDSEVQLEDTSLGGNYKLTSRNWYTAKPYGFKINIKGQKLPITMFLPISPSNLTINTHFATNLIPTLYGTVEEHSDIRYFDIAIEGTTGFAPKFVQPQLAEPHDAFVSTVSSGRASFTISETFTASGAFPKTMAALNQIKQKATDFFDGGPKAQKGLIDGNSGYVAFHNLYRLLLKYKKDASGISGGGRRTKHPITFFNYKDNNEYDVVIKGFSMKRSAENPMLYSYSIQMTGYNLRTTASMVVAGFDLLERERDLGLDGVDGSSKLGEFKNKVGKAKSLMASFAGGIPNIGR